MDLLQAISQATPWAAEAACVDAEIEFVPDARHSERDPRWVVPRLDYCARCRVRSECLAFGLETVADGCFGGTLTEERLAKLPARSLSHQRHEWEEDSHRQERRGKVPGVAEELERGFSERYAEWRRQLDAMAKPCERCGEVFHAWPKQRRRHCPSCTAKSCPKCRERRKKAGRSPNIPPRAVEAGDTARHERH